MPFLYYLDESTVKAVGTGGCVAKGFQLFLLKCHARSSAATLRFPALPELSCVPYVKPVDTASPGHAMKSKSLHVFKKRSISVKPLQLIYVERVIHRKSLLSALVG